MSTVSYFGPSGAGQQELYYRYPTRVPPLAVINALIVGLGVGAVAAAVYAYSIAYIPIIYLNLILVGLFGAALGFVPAYAMRKGKVTSVSAMVGVAMIVTAVCYYLHWVVWLVAISHQRFPLGFLLAHPRAVVELLKLVNETGIWSMSKGETPVSGIALDVVWLVEAAGIFACAWLVAVAQRGETPFCETCSAWCPVGTKIRRIQAGDTEDLRRRLEARDWSYLDAQGPSPEGANRWFAIFHHACPQCGQLHTISAKDIVVGQDKRGNVKTISKTIVDKLLVDPREVEVIREKPIAPPTPPAVPTQAGEAGSSSTNDRAGGSSSAAMQDGFGLD
ncbi:MAG TPA: hypothetical protein VH370_11190 [Humisphaera sp.]|jgi:hypothetical protein|nr:hypothetical protein [Humisphaera sp.]